MYPNKRPDELLQKEIIRDNQPRRGDSTTPVKASYLKAVRELQVESLKLYHDTKIWLKKIYLKFYTAV